MQSRRDQVDARSDELARLSSALMSGAGDLPESPARRDGLSTAAGAAVAAVVAAAVLTVGALSGASSSQWRKDGALVVDKDTGSRYVYRAGVLHPVTTLAGLTLLLGERPEPRLVSGRTLRHVPRGEPVGVPGLPDTLPPAAGVNRGTWRVCPVPGGRAVSVTLGAPAATPLPDGDGALVTSGGRDYLLWRGLRLQLPGPTTAALLGWAGAPKATVAADLLDAVPAGPDLAPARVPQRGRTAGPVAGRPSRVGDLYVVPAAEGTASAAFVRLADGLAALTPLDLQLELARPGAKAPTRLSAADVSAAPRARAPYRSGAFPATPPTPHDPSSGVVCAQYPSATQGAGVDLVAAAPTAEGVRTVPGTGRLVRPLDGSLAGPAGEAGAVLVAEDGRAYPVADPAALGYRDVAIESVPASYLRLLPQGGPGSTTPGTTPSSTDPQKEQS